jgi:hypothetical protein
VSERGRRGEGEKGRRGERERGRRESFEQIFLKDVIIRNISKVGCAISNLNPKSYIRNPKF